MRDWPATTNNAESPYAHAHLRPHSLTNWKERDIVRRRVAAGLLARGDEGETSTYFWTSCRGHLIGFPN